MTGRGQKNGPGWRFLEHTADIRVEIYGTDMKEVFAHAALALTQVLSPEAKLAASDQLELNLQSGGYEDLLVEWLREILFQNQTTGFLAAEPRITELTPTRIKATLNGCYVDMEALRADFEIKGVTYHGLSIKKEEDTYIATVVFDV
ncbi:MAG: archease [Thermodesulfobacteriota bacterium]